MEQVCQRLDRAHFNVLEQAAENISLASHNLVFLDQQKDLPAELSVVDLLRLQERLGYTFSNAWLPRLAFIHSSAAEINNTSLAWVGDAALGLVAAECLLAQLGVAPQV
jgi:hypothetical protein